MRVQRAGERDVVDVVSGRLRERPVLSPAGHAAVDEPRVSLQANLRTEPETLHDAGAEAFDQRVGVLDDAKHRIRGAGLLQVDGKCPPPALGGPLSSLAEELDVVRAMGAIDANHLGAHVGKHHGAERRRADTCHLDNFESCQRSHRHLPKNEPAGLPPMRGEINWNSLATAPPLEK